METDNCIIIECTRFGVKVIPGLVLCRYHRKRVYHMLCEIHAEEQKGTYQPPPKPKSKAPARKSLSKTAQRKRDREIRAVALNAAGHSVYRHDMTKIGHVSECSGGLPSLGRNR
jgi:hypothetical protein